MSRARLFFINNIYALRLHTPPLSELDISVLCPDPIQSSFPTLQNHLFFNPDTTHPNTCIPTHTQTNAHLNPISRRPFRPHSTLNQRTLSQFPHPNISNHISTNSNSLCLFGSIAKLNYRCCRKMMVQGRWSQRALAGGECQ